MAIAADATRPTDAPCRVHATEQGLAQIRAFGPFAAGLCEPIPEGAVNVAGAADDLAADL